MFSYHEYFPGVYHIQDSMGVCMTLFSGRERAVLFDAGYGLEDPRPFLKTLTDMPLTIYLTHGHHDHILGAAWFEKTFMSREDLDEFHLRTGEMQRRSVASQAESKALRVPESFLGRTIPDPAAIEWDSVRGGFDYQLLDIGGIRLNIFRVPGHTPGSIMVLAEPFNLLLTADNWNPVTWLWFPSSLDVLSWKRNMERFLSGISPAAILCSHQPGLRTIQELRTFLSSVTSRALKTSESDSTGLPAVNTHHIAMPDGSLLVFDYEKYSRACES